MRRRRPWFPGSKAATVRRSIRARGSTCFLPVVSYTVRGGPGAPRIRFDLDRRGLLLEPIDGHAMRRCPASPPYDLFVPTLPHAWPLGSQLRNTLAGHVVEHLEMRALAHVTTCPSSIRVSVSLTLIQ
jgi:hypothetical protein